MELIVIGENRLKIMLTGEDMAHYDLTEPDSAEESTHSVTPHTRKVLRHIFADANSQIGFDTEGESETYFSVVIRDSGNNFAGLLTYFTLFIGDFVPVGIYKNLE